MGQSVADAGCLRDETTAGVETRVGSNRSYLEVDDAVTAHEHGMVDAGASEA
ncbi:MAG: hypothetical protein PVG27_05000 [Chloroflexota bacterium]